MDAYAALEALEAVKRTYGSGASAEKLACLKVLARRRLGDADGVLRLHEALGFLRAYPDDAEVLAAVEAMLGAFQDRGDLKRARRDLDDTGVAGTRIHYAFYLWTAEWLARRHPGALKLDWSIFETKAKVLEQLWLLLTYAEGPALEEVQLSLKAWIEELKGPDETDAGFLAKRLHALDAGPFVREAFYDALEIPMWIQPGEGTPSRTHARHAPSKVTYQTQPLDTKRPNLKSALGLTPLRVRKLDEKQGRVLVEMAREAMVTRSRDLDVFMHGDARDVVLYDWEDGLQFAAIGYKPERRILLEGVYGFLTLKNGVPMGYVLASGLYGSSEIAYNVFDTYRGGEAGRVFGRVIATVGHLLGSDTFTIDPYQLGYGNQEGLQSGAWWFYRKLGFEPVDPDIRKLERGERAAMKRNPRHRTDVGTLEQLAADNVYYFAGTKREDVMGLLDLGGICLGLARYVAQRFGAEREKGERVCAKEAAALLGVRSFKGWTKDEREAWRRWGVVVMALKGVSRWSAANRRAFAKVIRAKGGRREMEFVRLFNAHGPLRRALLRLAD